MSKFVTKGASGRERYFIDNKQVSQEEFDRALAEEKAALPQIDPDPEMAGNRPWSKPIVSEALAYHRRQVPEAREHFSKLGLSPDLIRPDGKVVLPDRATRREVLRKNGYHDNQGGYSD